MKESIRKLVWVFVLTLCFSLPSATGDAKMGVELDKYFHKVNEVGVVWDKEVYKGANNLSEFRGQAVDDLILVTVQFNEAKADWYDYRIRSEFKVGAAYREFNKKKFSEEKQTEVINTLVLMHISTIMHAFEKWPNGLTWYINNINNKFSEPVTTVGDTTVELSLQPDPEGGSIFVLEAYGRKADSAAKR